MKKGKILSIFLLLAMIFTIAPGPFNSTTKAATLGSRILKYGSKGSDVKSLQYNLKKLGYYTSTISGNYYSKTKSAVIKFQKKYKLKATGNADKTTINKIKSIYNYKFNPKYSSNSFLISKAIAFKAKKKIVLGYTAVDYYNDNYSYNSVKNFSSNIDSISTFSHLISAKGSLIGTSPKSTITLATEKNIAPFLLIHNYNRNGFDRKLARAFLQNPSARKNLISQLLKTMKADGYIGVNVDIENVYPSDRKYYTAFIKELSSALHSKGFLVVASIPAKVRDVTYDGWSGGFDYTEIGKAVDFAQIMAYDEHWFGGTPGPIASLPWVDKVAKYTCQTIPRNKVLLGIATYGYDWAEKSTKVIKLSNLNNLISTNGGNIEWNDVYQVPYYKYTDAHNLPREVWFENEASIKLKLDLVNKYGLRGIGIWRLGFETAEFWNTVDKGL